MGIKKAAESLLCSSHFKIADRLIQPLIYIHTAVCVS